jgi:non-specific serine/threonine protein kinase/serine/threonine-protein kinase
VTRDARAKELFTGALALPADQRIAFLREQCNGDDGLLAELLSLLGHHDSAGAGFLERRETAPARIGPYRVIRLVGQGGFGAVYEAQQESPVRRRVAVKILRAGLDTAEIIQRFSAERQALAQMTHPGIAKVFDAGATAETRPYVVMEFVDGEPITTFCRNLDLPARLSLFVDVCHAVQHAHQKGVIHRDLKPSNILVESIDGKPAPRIIDFGIAKALDDRASITTRRGQLIGTPGYMSPEQVRGMDIDTRADIFSLGAVLYELLAGAHPLILTRSPAPAPPSSNACLTDTEAKPPSSVSTETSELKGDLDAITLKAMAPDRDRRYDSVGALAADIQRYLAHEPVLAQPPSTAYRLRKFARRNRVALTALSAIAAALIIGLGLAVYGLLQAARSATRRSSAPASSRAWSVSWTTTSCAPPTPASPAGVMSPSRRPSPMPRPASRASSPRTRSWRPPIRVTIGEMQRTLGQYPAAIPQVQRAIDIRFAHLGSAHPETLAAIREMGVVLDDQGRHEEAADLFARVIDGRRQALGPEHAQTLQAMNDLAVADERCGRLAQAEELLRTTLEIRRRTQGPEHPDTLIVTNNLATALVLQDRARDAEPLSVFASERFARVMGPDDRVTLECRNSLGLVYLHQGRADVAEPILRDTLDRRRKVLGPDHLQVADSLSNLGECLIALRDPAAAEPLLRECLRLRESQRPIGH